jgi:hypothetical protein
MVAVQGMVSATSDTPFLRMRTDEASRLLQTRATNNPTMLRMNPMLHQSSGTLSLVRWGVVCVTAATCGLAAGQGQPAENAAVTARFEVTGQTLARLDNPEQGNTRVEAVGWSGRGSNSFGVGVGSTLERMAPAPRPAEQMQASMDVGVRWRSEVNSRQRVDVAAWRAVSGEVDERPAVTTRVEMQFASPRSASFAELGAVGMQLNGGSRVTLKISKGRPMFYYRSKF